MSGPQDPFRIHCVASKYIPCEGVDFSGPTGATGPPGPAGPTGPAPSICTEFPITGTGATGDCIRIAASPINCAQLSWNGPSAVPPNSWVITRPPAWTEVTVGPTMGQYPNLAAAFADGCPFVRVLETYTDTPTWDATAAPILPNILIYIDPGVTLTLDYTDTVPTLPTDSFVVRGSGNQSVLLKSFTSLNPLFGFSGTTNYILLTNIRMQFDPGNANIFLDNTTGTANSFERAHNVQFIIADVINGVWDPTDILELTDCEFVGGGDMSVIVTQPGGTGTNVYMINDCVMRGQFILNGFAIDMGTATPGTIQRGIVNGLLFELITNSTTLRLGGTIANIQPTLATAFFLSISFVATQVSNVTALSITVPPTGGQFTNITLENAAGVRQPLTLTSPDNNFNNLRCGALTFGGLASGNLFDNCRIDGALLIDGGGAVCTRNVIRGCNISTSATITGGFNTRFNEIHDSDIEDDITIDGSTNNTVNGCTTQDNLRLIGNATENTVTGCTMADSTFFTNGASRNTVTACRTTQVLFGSGGLANQFVQNNTVTGCIINSGVVFIGSTFGANIRLNVVSGCNIAFAAVTLDGGNTNDNTVGNLVTGCFMAAAILRGFNNTFDGCHIGSNIVCNSTGASSPLVGCNVSNCVVDGTIDIDVTSLVGLLDGLQVSDCRFLFTSNVNWGSGGVGIPPPTNVVMSDCDFQGNMNLIRMTNSSFTNCIWRRDTGMGTSSNIGGNGVDGNNNLTFNHCTWLSSGGPGGLFILAEMIELTFKDCQASRFLFVAFSVGTIWTNILMDCCTVLTDLANEGIRLSATGANSYIIDNFTISNCDVRSTGVATAGVFSINIIPAVHPDVTSLHVIESKFHHNFLLSSTVNLIDPVFCGLRVGNTTHNASMFVRAAQINNMILSKCRVFGGIFVGIGADSETADRGTISDCIADGVLELGSSGGLTAATTVTFQNYQITNSSFTNVELGRNASATAVIHAFTDILFNNIDVTGEFELAANDASQTINLTNIIISNSRIGTNFTTGTLATAITITDLQLSNVHIGGFFLIATNVTTFLRGLINNCLIDGAMTFSVAAGPGAVDMSTKISDCRALSFLDNGAGATSDVTISDCEFTGIVVGAGVESIAFGIFGTPKAGGLSNCTVSGNSTVGQIRFNAGAGSSVMIANNRVGISTAPIAGGASIFIDALPTGLSITGNRVGFPGGTVQTVTLPAMAGSTVVMNNHVRNIAGAPPKLLLAAFPGDDLGALSCPLTPAAIGGSGLNLTENIAANQIFT